MGPHTRASSPCSYLSGTLVPKSICSTLFPSVSERGPQLNSSQTRNSLAQDDATQKAEAHASTLGQKPPTDMLRESEIESAVTLRGTP